MKHPPVAFAGSASAPGQFPRDGLPEIAFLGRSNVGKSSLLNALAGARQLARVSGQPGRTQLVNFFRVGDEMYLTDLPGYGFARVSEAMRRGWERLVTSYLVDREAVALGVFIVDARHEPMEGDERLKAWLEHEGLPYLVVAAKADKIGKGEVARRVAALRRWADRARDVVAVSARDGRGIDALWRGIRDSAEDWRSRRRRA